jgi:hypothetical protein
MKLAYPIAITITALTATAAKSDSVTAEDRALVAKLCRNVTMCEQQQLKQLLTFKNAQPEKLSAIAANKTRAPQVQKPADVTNDSTSIPSSSQTSLTNILPFLYGCESPKKQLFVRADSLDNFNYLEQLNPTKSAGASPGAASDTQSPPSADTQSPNAAAKGASLAYSDNRNASTQTANINGRISYIVFGRQKCLPPPMAPGYGGDIDQGFISGFAVAPFISSNGTWSEPFTSLTTTTKASSNKSISGTASTVSVSNGNKTVTTTTTSKGTITTTTAKTSTSALRFGSDFQIAAFSNTYYGNWLNFFYASPYYQTDFRGAAEIGGVDFSWQPVNPQLYLGVAAPNDLFSFLWQLKAEAELTQISNPGYTAFTSAGRHALFGEQIRANLALFPFNSGKDDPFDKWVAGRFSLIGTQQYYFDVATKQNAPYYTAQLQYKFGACKAAKGALPDSPCSVQGSSSLALEYDWGRDKDTYVKTNQIKVTLNYSY